MEKRTTYSASFLIRTIKRSKNEALIYCRITVGTQRVEFSLKKKVRKIIWNNGQAKANTEEGRAVNAYLKQVESDIFQHYRDMLTKRMLITAESLRDEYLGLEPNEHSLLSLIEYHNLTMKGTLADGTLKNYFTTEKYLRLFLKSRLKRNDMFLAELNYKFIVDLEYFLRKWTPKDHQRPLGNNGIMKHMERFRKVINLAVRMEWMEKDPFAKYKKKFVKVERECLTIEELAAIEKKEFGIPRLQFVRDLFVFGCYTGLAYIDAMSLDRSCITTGIDGGAWLNTSRKKTLNPVRVPLLPKAMGIIDRYKDHPKAVAEGGLFPKISNQKLNGYLKEIADLCGIEKNLTFHLARHTFATTVTLSNGVPIESVSKMLGHSKITTTQLYAKVIEKKLSEDMELLKEKLNKPMKL
jgi:site-specific recombinase XerD